MNKKAFEAFHSFVLNIDVNDLPLHTDEDTEDLKKQIEKPFSISIEEKEVKPLAHSLLF